MSFRQALKRLALGGGIALAYLFGSIAIAANRTPTPVVGPTETGEWDGMQQQIVDMARLKMGSCTATATGSGAAGGSETATCNGAAGVVTTVSLTIATVGALNTLTVTNSKVQAGDMVQCTLDSTGAAGTSAPICSAVQVSAGSIAFIISNLLAVSPASAVKIYFMINTQGNPN